MLDQRKGRMPFKEISLLPDQAGQDWTDPGYPTVVTPRMKRRKHLELFWRWHSRKLAGQDLQGR